MFNSLINLLRADGSIIINKVLAKNIGLNEAILYGELLSKYSYYYEHDELTEDGYFFCTVDDLEFATTLSDYAQRKAITNLVEYGLISTSNRGIPMKRYFTLIMDEDLVIQFLKNSRTSSQKTKELVLKKLKSNNNIINNTKINKKNNTSKKVDEPSQGLNLQKPKTSPKSKKASEYAIMVKMANVFSDDEEVKEKLIEYLAIRHKKGLVPSQWEIILQDFKDMTKSSSSSFKVECLKNSIAGGYLKIYPKGPGYSKRGSFDNTKGVETKKAKDLTRTELANLKAKDSLGNDLRF